MEWEIDWIWYQEIVDEFCKELEESENEDLLGLYDYPTHKVFSTSTS